MTLGETAGAGRLRAIRWLLDCAEGAADSWRASGRELGELALVCRGRPSLVEAVLPCHKEQIAANLSAAGPALELLARKLLDPEEPATPLLFHPAPNQAPVFQMAWLWLGDQRARRPSSDSRRSRRAVARPRKRAAVHEAGHAVLDLAAGWIPTSVDVLERDKAWGSTETLAVWEARMESRQMRHAVLVSLWGGMEAERLRSRQSTAVLVLHGGRGDFDVAWEIASMSDAPSGGVEQDPAEELERARRSARVLVKKHRRAIEAVACGLLHAGRLRGDEVEHIVNSAVST